jgi:hypothetical protein
LAQDSNDSNIVHQNFHAAVGKVAGHDIIQTNVTAIDLLQVLETAVQESGAIPEPQKTGLRHRLRSLAENPYVSGLATSAIHEGLKAFFR